MPHLPPTGAMELGPYNTGNELPTQQFIAPFVGTRFIASVVRPHAQCNNPPHTLPCLSNTCNACSKHPLYSKDRKCGRPPHASTSVFTGTSICCVGVQISISSLVSAALTCTSPFCGMLASRICRLN